METIGNLIEETIVENLENFIKKTIDPFISLNNGYFESPKAFDEANLAFLNKACEAHKKYQEEIAPFEKEFLENTEQTGEQFEREFLKFKMQTAEALKKLESALEAASQEYGLKESGFANAFIDCIDKGIKDSHLFEQEEPSDELSLTDEEHFALKDSLERIFLAKGNQNVE